MNNSAFNEIKYNMRRRSMQLWGVEHEDMLDPLIGMMLDVFSYEISKIHQHIKISDSKLVERLAKVLVNENWSLPTPAHALLQATPEEQMVEITNSAQFFSTKFNFGEENSDLFFTPLRSHYLMPARIHCTAFHKAFYVRQDLGLRAIKHSIQSEKKIEDYNIYVGIDIGNKILNNLKSLPITLLLDNSELDAYIHMIKVFDIDDNELSVDSTIDLENIANEPHYFKSTHNYYKNYLYTIGLEDSSKRFNSAKDVFKTKFSEETYQEETKELYWLRINFPVSFVAEELAKFKVMINAFPVVNRKLLYKQHSLDKNGRIVSLPALNDSYYLGVEEVMDNKGIEYQNILKNDINKPEGSYSIYFGNVEQFDERAAKATLYEVIQTIREEGSSFSAVGYDLLNAYLEDLNVQLDDIEHKISSKLKKVSDNNERQYLIAMPYEKSEILECNYWISNANNANGIEANTVLNQYQNYGLKMESVRFQTKTIGGDIKRSEKEKISNLRYGLLSRDRIVSEEDVREFVVKTVGEIVDDVSVKPGVGIAVSPKQGLVRTTDVTIKINKRGKLDQKNKTRLSHFLKLELEDKSVQNIPYKVAII